MHPFFIYTPYALEGCIARDTNLIIFDTAARSVEAVQNSRSARPQRAKGWSVLCVRWSLERSLGQGASWRARAGRV